MRRHASVHDRLTVCQGSADVVPFENGFFDLVFSVNVIHHVLNPRNHFREALRVLRPGGSICTVTDSTDMIRRREPLSRYWPSSAEADVARYPTVGSLLDSMARVGFTDLTSRDIKETYLVTDARPYREKAFSCLRLIAEVEFDAGFQRLENDLRRGAVQGISEYICIWGKVPTTI